MTCAAIVLIGVISLTKLPVELMPDIGYKKITIMTRVRGGMPPEEVEELVTKPIEDAVSTASRIEELMSISKKGESQVIIKFEPGTDMDFAALEVREKFARVKNKLPREIERPVIARYEESDAYVMIAAVTSTLYTTEYLRKLIDEDIKEYLLRVDGVANVDVIGGRERRILVEFDEDKLDAYGLPILSVIERLGINNLNLLVGEVEDEKNKYMLRTMGEYRHVDDIRHITVATTDNDSLLTLSDVAIIDDSFLDPENYARLGMTPVKAPRDIVSLYIHKESVANTIHVVRGVREQINGPIRNRLKDMGLVLGDDLTIEVVTDQAEFIVNAIDTVRYALIFGAILAAFVLYYFLRNRRSTIIIFTSIPTSVIATFALMYFRNMLIPQSSISINVMTLSGLALGIGMLVDNSIVVLENIFSKHEEGLSLRQAAIDGPREVITAIVASTVTTIIVFLPIVFVAEDIKMLYGALAITVTFSLLASLFVALTLIPSLSAHFLKVVRRGLDMRHIRTIYRRWLVFALRRRYFFVTVSLCALIIAVMIFRTLDREFLGQTEQGKFTVYAQLEAGAKLDATDTLVSEIEDILSMQPAIESYSTRIEGWSARIYVSLLPYAEARQTTEDVIAWLRPRVKEVERKYKGGFIYFSDIQAPGLPEVQIDIYGHDYEKINSLLQGVVQGMAMVPGLVDLKRTQEKGRPEYRIVVDKDKAAYYGFSTQDVADIVHAEMRGLRATLFHTESKEVETVARLRGEDRKTFDDIRNLLMTTPRGDSIYLRQIASFEPAIGPSEIHRRNKNRFVRLSGTSTLLSLDKAVGRIRNALKDLTLPRDYYWEFSKEYEKQVRNQRQLMYALGLTLLLVYMVLASLFESYYQPFIIMISIPLAYIGAIIILWAADKPVGTGVIIGAIMLGGIVVNNAIILIDHVNRLRESRHSLSRAVLGAGADRLRPILLTTSTTILTLIPMALDRSEASNLWSPLAVTVIGGLSLSTILTLILLPSIYIIFEDITRSARRHTVCADVMRMCMMILADGREVIGRCHDTLKRLVRRLRHARKRSEDEEVF